LPWISNDCDVRDEMDGDVRGIGFASSVASASPVRHHRLARPVGQMRGTHRTAASRSGA
jgi:hypothetical protein